ncbi:MAG TPA: NAD(P)H-hydrate dehydratase [Acidimicrobiales bacterium]|nr:NAD(P)H-hydrate dehydratase [Acidimicrobiales bacterium]
MIPVLTPEEMGEVDRSAPEPVEVLIGRAGSATARAAGRMLGGTYGRRVVVVAGKGNNGADGREAARRLRARGVRVTVVEATDAPNRLPPCDLVVDAAYGTGFRGEYQAPDPGGAPVLAVDIPSGVNGLTGEAPEGAVQAAGTVTFAALKPGLVLTPGRLRAGELELVDIGLDVSGARIGVVERCDVAAWLPARAPDSHKWKSAVYVVAGSPGMTGAAQLCARSALRTGAGSVRLGIPGSDPDPGFMEVVGRTPPGEGWADYVLEDSERAKALVVGPGLARTDATREAVRRLVAKSPLPAVLDADGLYALGDKGEAAEVLRDRGAPTLLTPHDGEFRRLEGASAGADRVEAARSLARDLNATVLLKGPTTVVAAPDGDVHMVTSGDARLATAGSGDVLAGIAGAFLAMQIEGLRAASGAAFVHGYAAGLGWRRGLVAGDLLDLLPNALVQLA